MLGELVEVRANHCMSNKQELKTIKVIRKLNYDIDRLSHFPRGIIVCLSYIEITAR